MTPETLLRKARRAVESARLLLSDDDIDGACNRAYYGMFDAAKAALILAGAPVEAELIKTHSGLITAFSLHVVKQGRVPIDLGRDLNRAAEIRLVSDYSGEPVDSEKVKWMVQRADEFIQEVERLTP